MKNILFFILFSATCQLVNAQGFEAGIGGGVSYYFGDLNTNINLSKPGPAGGVFGRFVFNERLALKAGASYTKLGFYDSYTKNEWQLARNLSFESHVIDVAAQLEFHFMKYIHGDKEKFYTPYIFGGPALFYYDPKTRFNDEWVRLQPLGTEGQQENSEYTLVQPAIAYGIGFKIDINVDWSINFEVSGRALFTDYLDDVSKTYVGYDELENSRGELAAMVADRSIEINDIRVGEPGRQRGDSKSRDKYVLTGISIVYNFSQVKCPEF